MIINLAKAQKLPETTVIPIAQNDSLAQILATIASDLKVPSAVLQQDFKAEHCEIHTFYAGSSRIFLLGLGIQPGFAEILKAFRSFSHKNRQKLSSSLCLTLRYGNEGESPFRLLEAAVNGLWLGTYRIGRFKTQNGERHPLTLPAAQLVLDLGPIDPQAALTAAQRGYTIADTQSRAFDLVNAPSNKKHPADLGNWALASGKAFGYRVEVMDKAQIEATGLHALLAVNRGSENPPAFIIMEHRPQGLDHEKLPRVGLVGKGVTFDTGGLSIKPSTNMHYMKSDMGGAAAVFGTMELAARLELPVHLIGIVPATDNSVDAKAIKPSDVIDSYSGKTIEVIDTDAEGRLILADGLAYMVRHFQPGVLIDLATLTGSTVRTFGYHAAALFSNNDHLAATLERLGDLTGERTWRLPIWDIYKDDIKSDVADVRNFSGKPIAGAIGAAKFLEVFTAGHPAWCHLDIAGVAFADSEFASQKSATAFGVRLLVEYLSQVGKEGKV